MITDRRPGVLLANTNFRFRLHQNREFAMSRSVPMGGILPLLATMFVTLSIAQANICRWDNSNVPLFQANLRNADLTGADLRNANLWMVAGPITLGQSQETRK